MDDHNLTAEVCRVKDSRCKGWYVDEGDTSRNIKDSRYARVKSVVQSHCSTSTNCDAGVLTCAA